MKSGPGIFPAARRQWLSRAVRRQSPRARPEKYRSDAGLINGQFGITDISLAAPVRLLDLARAPLDAERWPRFEAYYRSTINRPSAQSIYAEELSATEVFRITGDAPQ